MTSVSDLSQIFLENVKDYALFTTEPSSRIVSWNSGAERMFGYRERELLGKFADVLFTDEDRAKELLKREHESALKCGRSMGLDGHVRSDRSRLWGEWTTIPLYDPASGELRGFGKLLRNMTDRKTSDEFLKMQALVLGQMAEGVSISEEGNLRYPNPTEDRMFGYKRGELLGQHVSLQNPGPPEDDQSPVDGVIAPLRRAGAWEGQWENPRRDGSRFVFHSRISDLELHGKKYLVCVQDDVTEKTNARESVKDSEIRLRFALEAAQAGEWELDLESLKVRRSAEHDRIFGYETLQPNWSYRIFLRHVLPEARRDLTTSFRKALLVGSWEVEVPIRRADGQTRWIWIKGRVPQCDEESQRTMHGLLGDITERKQSEEALRQSEELRNRIIQSSQDCISVLDLEGRLLSMSEAGRESTGMDDVDLFIGKSWIDFWVGADREGAAEAVKAAQEGRVGRFTGFFPTISGTPKWWDVIVSPILAANGTPYRLLSVSRDITQIKEAEARLKEQLDHLVRSNSELARFAHAASHDLKEPLRMVTSFVQLLDRKYGAQLDEEGARYIEFAVEGATRMYTLLDGLLELSHISIRPEPLRPIDCGNVIQRVLADMNSSALREEAEITVDAMPIVTGDPSQVYQIFQNLISNAIKFHGLRAPKIHIGFECRNEEWVFCVKDNGIGIDERYSEQVFCVFQRLNTREIYPGAGVGLAVCKKVIERHGGRIWLESSLGQGATFYFTLPNREGDRLRQPALTERAG